MSLVWYTRSSMCHLPTGHDTAATPGKRQLTYDPARDAKHPSPLLVEAWPDSAAAIAARGGCLFASATDVTKDGRRCVGVGVAWRVEGCAVITIL